MTPPNIGMVRDVVRTVAGFERALLRQSIWEALGEPDHPEDEYLLKAAQRIRALRWLLEDAGNAGSLVRLELEARDAAHHDE